MANRRFMGGVNEFSWEFDQDMDEMDTFSGSNYRGDYRNKRYSDAYGDYNGGYGPIPPLGFGPGPGPDFWPRPPPPTIIMGRGFRPGGPPPKRVSYDDRPLKYLLRCGVPKESIKNLPKALLQLYEPQYCGLCGQSFESFPSSRMHYISKNHSKAQKRWLAERIDLTVPNKESALKAREIYCELCDVQITSKPHGESHYAGKPHRAIVEGRKNPKNPLLLQKSMEKRFEQLIRREKKHLKMAVDEPTVEKNPETKTDSPKILQPELYCDICKVNMTCSDQMTSHLNGKKHLAKEKQHILKMMTVGNTGAVEGQNENDAAKKVDEETVTAAAAEGDATQDQGQAEDDFDWGAGSGAWDEPAKEE